MRSESAPAEPAGPRSQKEKRSSLAVVESRDDNRTANSSAKLIALVRRSGRRCGRRSNSGIQLLIAQKLPKRAVQLILARLDDRIDDAPLPGRILAE